MLNSKDKDELNDFKTNINLVDYCLSKGYDYKKGYANKNHETTHIVVERRSADNSKIEGLVIHRNPSSKHWLYFNPKNQLDKGTIIDFCSNKFGFNLGEIRKELRAHSGQVRPTKHEITPAAPLRPRVIDEQYFEIKPLTDTSYLKSRFLSEAVLNHPVFFDTVGIKTVAIKGQNDKPITFNNTAFPIKSIDGNTIGLVLKNKTYNSEFKGNMSDSSTVGMWMSNAPKNKGPIKFGLVENPIDAMSHFQLKIDQLSSSPNMMYFSSNGILRDQHIDHVQHYIDIHRPDEVFILTDNDNAGIRYAITYLGQLRHPADIVQNVRFYKDEDVKIKCLYTEPINQLRINLFNTPKIQNKEVIDNINDFFKTKNEDLFAKYGLKKEEFKIESICQTDVVTEVRVDFDNRKELLMDAVEITQFLRPTQHLRLDLSADKDYNKDLQNKVEAEKQLSVGMGLGK